MTDEQQMPRYDGMEYEELVAAAQFLWMENAKLREMLSESRQANEHIFTELKRYKNVMRTRPIAMNALFDENTRLRRLARGLNWCTENAKVPSAECERCPLGDTEDGELSCEKLMRELRIEAN